jgi:mannitol-1-/sugar-/sorbitol-6-phosphatase
VKPAANVNLDLPARRFSPSVRYHDSMIVIASALLFDLDGVLADSTAAVTRVWRQWAIEHGFEPEKTVREAHGRPSIETIHELLPDSDYEALNRELEAQEIADLDGVVALPGAIELLNSLPPASWAIVTSCTRDLAAVRIRAAGLPLPPNIVTSNDIANGKPNPEPYLKGASKLGVRPADCIVLEDVPAGIRAGKAAGARVIALRTTAMDEELRSASPDWILDSCASITASSDPDTGLLRLSLSLD